MAFLFGDSFDDYATANLLLRWYSGTAVIGAYGRNGTNGLLCAANVATVVFTPAATVIVGGAFKIRGAVGTVAFLQLSDGATVHVDLRLDGSGRIVITRNGTVLETSSFVPSLDVWYHIQLKVTIADSGTYFCRINGVEIFSTNAGDTRNAGNASVDRIQLYAPNSSSGNGAYWDDFWVCNDSGATCNDFLGDIRGIAQFPNADGSNTAWTASAGTDVSCVDEAAPNGDTDYIKDLTPGNISSFTFPALGVTGSVKAVVTNLYARKDDAGSRSIREYCKSGGTAYNGATKSLSDSYLYLAEVREIDPKTSAAWLVANVDAAEEGVELVS